MIGRERPVARLDDVTHRYGATYRARRGHARYPERLHGRLDRPGRRRQVIAAGPHRRRAAYSDRPGSSARRRHGGCSPSRAQSAARIAYMPQGLGKNLYPDLSVRENIEFFGRLFGQPRDERERRIARTARQHRPGAVRGPAGKEALRRHAAEARAVLRADPRSGSADPRRADDRRRSAVAPAVLGPDRSDACASARHERHHRHRLYGGSRAVRLARRHGCRQGSGRRDLRRKSRRRPGATTIEDAFIALLPERAAQRTTRLRNSAAQAATISETGHHGART